MLFSIGTKVKFKHTGDYGEITGRLGDGMVNVYLEEEDMEIPTFEDDLVRVEDEYKKSSVKAKFVPAKKAKKPVERPQAVIETQYTIIKSKGIQLAFDPIHQSDGLVEKYRLFLINDTRNDALFTFELFLNSYSKKKASGRLPATSTFEVGEMLYDQLNDYPEIDMECWKITTSGTGSRLFKTLKIKPKNFFKKVITAPLLNRRVHWYVVFDKLEKTNKQAGEDLKSYTKRNVVPLKTSSPYHQHDPHNIREYAAFRPEIDLHIESLITSTRKMTNAEILKIQLSHFELYLAKAIELGISPVFIIHGVGKGRLRDEIATSLIQNRDVVTFKNEYHPKYGWGATEVIL